MDSSALALANSFFAAGVAMTDACRALRGFVAAAQAPFGHYPIQLDARQYLARRQIGAHRVRGGG